MIPNRLLQASALLFFIFFWGCAAVTPRPDSSDAQRAKALITRAKEMNAAVATSKGTARLTLAEGHRKQRYKMAWAAQSPRRLRLTLLMSGHPIETIAASGDWVKFVSHTGRHKPHSAVSVDPDLEPYINIPVRLSEMISLLLGQVPVRPFDRAWTLPDQTRLVMASKQFTSHIQEIRFDDQGRVTRYRLLDKDNALVYGIWYNDFKPFGEHVLPGALTIADRSGRTLDLTVSTLIPNAPVKESIFRLTGAGS